MGKLYSQHKNYACGAYALINALSALGFETDYDTVSELAGTNQYGTSRRGIRRAIEQLGYQHVEYFTRNSENACKWLARNAPYCPIIMLVDDYEHYVTLTGTMNGSVVLVDSSMPTGYEKNVQVIPRQDVLERWCHRGGYWAVKVSVR